VYINSSQLEFINCKAGSVQYHPSLNHEVFKTIIFIFSQFEKLQVVWLREHNVSGPGEQGELLQLCPNIQELDLSRNLIHSWQSLARIADQLRHLRVLNIRYFI
jgi:Leucine-rich repeat (LRR) protein